MNPSSIIIVILMAVGFACAALFIAKNGGWKGEGCQGHCASCDHHCADPEVTRAKWEAEETQPESIQDPNQQPSEPTDENDAP